MFGSVYDVCVRARSQANLASTLSTTSEQQRTAIAEVELTYNRRVAESERQREESIHSLSEEHDLRLAHLEESHTRAVTELERTYSVSGPVFMLVML